MKKTAKVGWPGAVPDRSDFDVLTEARRTAPNQKTHRLNSGLGFG